MYTQPYSFDEEGDGSTVASARSQRRRRPLSGANLEAAPFPPPRGPTRHCVRSGALARPPWERTCRPASHVAAALLCVGRVLTFAVRQTVREHLGSDYLALADEVQRYLLGLVRLAQF